MCTRAVWTDAAGTVLVGRNMDWMTDTGTNLWAFPRGMTRDDGLGGTISWTSRYGSLVASAYDLMTVDGLNDQGLGAHQLFLPESNYGEPDDRTALSVAVWMQYVLDNFASVAEAVAWMEASQLRIAGQSDPLSDTPVTLHLALEDASGDSAIIEYLDGRPQIWHARTYTVVTNSPPYREQLEHLKTIQGLGGANPLPGGNDAIDRFARAAYYVSRLPEPAGAPEAIASLLSVMRNASQPFRIPDPDRPHASQTQWRTIIDLEQGILVFESTHRPNIVWARIRGLDLSPGAPVLRLDLVSNSEMEHGLVGDVTDQFTETPAMAFLPAA